MKVSIHRSIRWMPEGAYHRTLKAEAEVVEGDLEDLLWDLVIYRYVLQRVIDVLWDLDVVPEKSQIHQMFYNMLRGYGFRAHVARNIYSTAIALVESAKSNGGSKPVIRRLSARLDHQDAKVDLSNRIVRIILRDRWYILRISHRDEYIERFKGLKWKEVHIKYYNGKLYISIVFETRYAPYIPRGVVALDVNFRHIVSYDGSEVRRYRTRFIDALGKRARAEEIQRKYPKRWRYSEKILDRIRALHRKSRNIVVDWCRKFAKEIVLKAKKRGYAIALEDLEKLRESFNDKNSKIVWKLTLFAYRKLQESIMSKAIEYNVPIIFVDPRKTSSKCPRCRSKIRYIGRLGICHRCGFRADRDKIGAMNIWLKVLEGYAGVPGSPPRAPAMKSEARQSRGIRHEGMKKVIRSI
ncbi:transposase, IS605 OrfB family [Ignisphaera aggregans DSM 17230]|uniref:Transposase, IS605 OrfB family n=1 Tax=Ignisphaera aggregans (strain DSM 17230 / JCM 13409 / AQ1.S1) TaxID=583356 RepID=E0SSR5_IGNAA|nr:transposase, IS605 OrfB family [Ignisphaera aggregans DSM 17230]